MELSFKQKLFYFFPVLFCFCLPFGSYTLSLIAALWGATSFFNIEKVALRSGFLNRNLWLLYIFFIITCVSALFSKNGAEAGFSIEVKLSFFALPYYIFCFNWPIQIIKKCLVAFVSGCFFACVYLIVRASVYSFNGHPEYFFYTAFSNFIHASYFAMYLIMAISIIFIYYHIWFKEQRQYTYISIFFITLFIITLFLCSSKLGIISFFVCLPILIFYRFKAFFNVKKVIIMFLGLFLGLFFIIKLFPEAFERLNSITSFSLSDIDKTSSESTTVRVLIWEQCISIIKSNFMFGVTVGDANDALYRAYEQNGLTGAFEHKFNAHNQYFQTFIGLGILGFLSLLAITFGQLIKAFIQKNMILLIFSLLIVLNFMVESMLQTSAGCLFFVFFFCLFNLPKIKNEILE